jgi:hypothetical protein
VRVKAGPVPLGNLPVCSDSLNRGCASDSAGRGRHLEARDGGCYPGALHRAVLALPDARHRGRAGRGDRGCHPGAHPGAERELSDVGTTGAERERTDARAIGPSWARSTGLSAS